MQSLLIYQNENNFNITRMSVYKDCRKIVER